MDLPHLFCWPNHQDTIPLRRVKVIVFVASEADQVWSIRLRIVLSSPSMGLLLVFTEDEAVAKKLYAIILI